MSGNGQVKDQTREFYYAFFREDPNATIDDAARAASSERGVIVRKDLISAIRQDVRKAVGAAIPMLENPPPLRAPIAERLGGPKVTVKPRLVSAPQPQPPPPAAPEPRTTAVEAEPPVVAPPEKPSVEGAVRSFLAQLKETGIEFQTFDLSIREGEAEFVFEIRQQRSGKVRL